VTLVDTGDDTMTGGRLKRVRRYLGDEPFCFTYGDGLSDVDVRAVIDHHAASGALATMTAVQPPGRFGAVRLEEQKIVAFDEKPQGDGAWINGGYFVLSPGVFDYIGTDQTVWEREPLEQLAADGKLSAFVHRGFWQPMDTLRDKTMLEESWASGAAPWKVWA
jgi:glucose-1-phosphate cytidylyltransferase